MSRRWALALGVSPWRTGRNHYPPSESDPPLPKTHPNYAAARRSTLPPYRRRWRLVPEIPDQGQRWRPKRQVLSAIGMEEHKVNSKSLGPRAFGNEQILNGLGSLQHALILDHPIRDDFRLINLKLAFQVIEGRCGPALGISITLYHQCQYQRIISCRFLAI